VKTWRLFFSWMSCSTWHRGLPGLLSDRYWRLHATRKPCPGTRIYVGLLPLSRTIYRGFESNGDVTIMWAVRGRALLRRQFFEHLLRFDRLCILRNWLGWVCGE
jgi:hypothetical protein